MFFCVVVFLEEGGVTGHFNELL